MNLTRWALVAVTLVMGGLQAWDSRVLEAPGRIQILAALAVLIPAGMIAVTARPALLILAGGLSLGLVVVAGLTSPTPLPALLVLALGMALLLYAWGMLAKRQTGKKEPPPAE
ncbi:MAG: hypothetical protein C4524_06010 [Candidatus Zixiibacteriota bacterium]|nr:MAG: hypothetical protein C4524_06010 [candidate division Zixibacteria bacterium]